MEEERCQAGWRDWHSPIVTARDSRWSGGRMSRPYKPTGTMRDNDDDGQGETGRSKREESCNRYLIR